MKPETIILICTTITGWLAAAFAWIKWLYEIREKRKEKKEKEKEKAAKEKAETELQEIRRRGDGPYLVPNDAYFNALYIHNGPGQVGFMQPGYPSLLCADRQEVSQDIEEPVTFLVENTGKAVRAVTIKLDGEEIHIEKEADMQDAHGFQFLVYPYYKDKHGKEQTITISFESSNGVHDTHHYKTRHGFRILKRVDPYLPA